MCGVLAVRVETTNVFCVRFVLTQSLLIAIIYYNHLDPHVQVMARIPHRFFFFVSFIPCPFN